MKFLSGAILLMFAMPGNTQAIEYKAINYCSGTKNIGINNIQYYIAKDLAGQHFNTSNTSFTLGILQPYVVHKASLIDFEKLIQRAVVGPNPFHNIISIQFNEPEIAIQTICIYDIYGNILFKEFLHQACIGFTKQIPLQTTTGNIIIVSIEYNMIANPAIHYIKQYKLISYE
jgi:hypothetical protein